MGSTRLPGKVLADLGGQPLLEFMLGRLRPLAVAHLVVATTDQPVDDPVADLVAGLGLPLVRGSEHDVLDRFVVALDQHRASTVVRLTADCPLTDPEVVEQALATHERVGARYTSNTLVRTFPDGLDVEVVEASALREAAGEATDPAEREHVTPFVYRRPERYRLASFHSGEDLGDERWTVDTADDLTRIRAIVDAAGAAGVGGWRDILAIAGRGAGNTGGRGGQVRLAAQPRDDPSIREWTVSHGGRPAGVLRVATEGGVGTLCADGVDGRIAVEALHLLQKALGADMQVRVLVSADRSLPRALAQAGFTEERGTMAWHPS
jgi:spore coat polysaccharide biosynthesis protein SpsF